MEAKAEQKSIPKRGANLRAKKLPLGTDVGRFGVGLGAVLASFFVVSSLVLSGFR